MGPVGAHGGLTQLDDQLNKNVTALLHELQVPGAALVLLLDGRPAWSGQFGVCQAQTTRAVQANTVFEAASMSKPLFAYLVLQAALACR